MTARGAAVASAQMGGLRLLFALVLFSGFSAGFAERVFFDIRAKLKDGGERSREASAEVVGGAARLTIPAAEIPDGELEISPRFARAKAGDEGFILLPTGAMTLFKSRPDAESIPWSPARKKEFRLRMAGMDGPEKSFIAIFESAAEEHVSKITLKDGVYRLSAVYAPASPLAGKRDIRIEYRFLPRGCGYSAMAREYRKWLLQTGQCARISDRASAELDYAASCVEIRMRLAWKPVPTPVEEQNLENEPAVRPKMTFRRAGEFLRGLKAAGVDRAQVCLVGWNISGHDGRWPTMFPVEPALGGEAELKKLTALARSLGYQIVCHTNSSDIYSISREWQNGAPAAKGANGKPQPDACWSGGRAYNLCPKMAWEFAKRDFPKIAALGFRGLHYIDVISTKPPCECLDPAHPCSRAESAEYMNKIMALAKRVFGGAASEGCADYVCANQDYALYVYYKLFRQLQPSGLRDRLVPLWEIVYNGIQLHNTATETFNYTKKTPRERLKLYEDGGRPIFYLYSVFSDSPSAAENLPFDIRADDGAQTRDAIAAILKGHNEYKKFARLQRLFINSHSEIAKDVFATVYEDGTEVVANYSRKPFLRGKDCVEPSGLRVFGPKH